MRHHILNSGTISCSGSQAAYERAFAHPFFHFKNFAKHWGKARKTYSRDWMCIVPAYLCALWLDSADTYMRT